jgi:hypothetical protein
VEDMQSIYENMREFVDRFGLNFKRFDEFLNFMGVAEKYDQSEKKSNELQKIYDESNKEYFITNKEYNELLKQSKSFKERISFRG